MPGLLGMSRDGTAYVVFVALAVCLVCSVLVSAAAVYLKPLQVANKLADRQRNVLEVTGLMGPGVDVKKVFDERIQTKIVDLNTGEYADNIDPAEFDQREASRDPKMSIKVPANQDIASIKRRSNYAEVYLVNDKRGDLQSIVLPVHGYGLWSTMYGFLALKPDGNTIVGLKYYEEGETPGLGGEVENPKWLALWPGKKVYGADGKPEIHVIKGSVSKQTPSREYKVDGLSGATLTSRGVSHMLTYWLGERGFQKYLDHIRQQPLAQGS